MMAALRLHVPLHEAQQWIRDGDLLLFRRRGLIAALGRGEHSHAALAGWWGETLCCLEVRSCFGGRVVTLASQVNRYPGRIDVYQADPDGRWPEFDREQTVQWMLQYAGEGYGYRGIFRVALFHIPFLRLLCRPLTEDNHPPRDPPFCSQACVAATRMGGGVDPVPQLADAMTEPADLARSPFYRYRATLMPDEGADSPQPARAKKCRLGFLHSGIAAFLVLLGVFAVIMAHNCRPVFGQGCARGSCALPDGPTGLVPPPTWLEAPATSDRTNDRVWPQERSRLTQAVGRIENRLPSGATIYGSGVLVGRDERWGWVLTCEHLFRDGVGRVTVWLPGDAHFVAYQAQVVARSAPDDLAVLAIAAPPNMTIEVANTIPRPGDLVTLAGFGPNGVLHTTSGQVLGYVQTVGTGRVETLQIRAAARDGDSGGPILDAAGRLVAVLWGTDGYRTVGTYCGRIRQFLAGIFGGERMPPGPPAGPLVPLPPPQNPPSDSPLPQSPRPESEPGGSGSSEEDAAGDPPFLARLQNRLEDLHQRVESHFADQSSLSEKLRQLEERTAVVGQLRERVERAESVVGPENIRAVIRQTAADLLAEKGPGWLNTLLPALLTALGWTGPPSLAIALAARLALRILERRLRQHVAEAIALRNKGGQEAPGSEKEEAPPQ